MPNRPHTELPEDDFLPLDPPGEPREESDVEYIFHHIGVLERLQRKVHRNIFSQFGLHPSQGVALMTIIQNPGQSQRELADRLHIERATLTVMVQKLEKGGFIERRADPVDQRILRLYPTEKGCESDREAHEACESLLSAAFAGLDAEACAAMAAQLRAIEANVNRFHATLICKKEPQP